MSVDLRGKGLERALPREAQDGAWEMQLRAGDEMRIDVEFDACLAAENFMKTGAPGFGGFLRERPRGHHAKRRAIRDLLPEGLELRLGERREVLFDLSEPRLRANLR